MVFSHQPVAIFYHTVLPLHSVISLRDFNNYLAEERHGRSSKVEHSEAQGPLPLRELLVSSALGLRGFAVHLHFGKEEG